jgi:alpha-L-rhamnosidase
MPKEAFATAWFARSTRTLARSAAALGRSADWHLYGALADRIDAAFTAAYVSSDGLVAGGSQAASALALHFGLVPHALEPLVFEKLVAAVEARGRSASTGIHSTAPLLLQLSRRGRHDLALELALRTAVPSWGAMINAGATTIWERWDGYVPGRGFQQPVMNSLNHVAFGSVVQWVFECVAGVSPDERGPGYRHIRIAPNVGRLTRARATIDSVRGRVESAWRREGAMLEMNVVVPPNAAATIVVPTNDPNGVVLEPPRTPVLVEPDRVGYEVGSGVYIARASTAPS